MLSTQYADKKSEGNITPEKFQVSPLVKLYNNVTKTKKSKVSNWGLLGEALFIFIINIPHLDFPYRPCLIRQQGERGSAGNSANQVPF